MGIGRKWIARHMLAASANGPGSALGSNVLLSLLPGGPTPAQIGAGVLTDTKGNAVTCTRASGKYCRTVANGSAVVLLGNNQPAVEPEGLLAEPAGTNLCIRSQEFDNAAWTAVTMTVTPDSAFAPDGLQTADRLISTAGAATITSTGAATASAVTYSGSVWIKLAAGSGAGFLKLKDSGGTFPGSTAFTATSTWTRITVSGTAVAAGSLSLQIVITNNAATLQAWGAQLELGSLVTSYVPTVATSATRAFDAFSVPLNGLKAGTGSIVSSITPQWSGSGPSGGATYFMYTAANTLLYSPGLPTPTSFLTGTVGANSSPSGAFAAGTPKSYIEVWNAGAGTSTLGQVGQAFSTVAFTGLTDTSGPLLMNLAGADPFWIKDILVKSR